MERIKIEKEELEYLWAFLMAMVNDHQEKAERDCKLINILAKIKRQFSYLLSMEELKRE